MKGTNFGTFSASSSGIVSGTTFLPVPSAPGQSLYKNLFLFQPN